MDCELAYHIPKIEQWHGIRRWRLNKKKHILNPNNKQLEAWNKEVEVKQKETHGIRRWRLNKKNTF